MDNSGAREQYHLHNEFFNVSRLSRNSGNGFQELLFGLLNQPAQTMDKEVTSECTNFLFAERHDGVFGSDLVTANIQRGRDHGVPSFCCYYKLYHDGNFDCHTQGRNIS